MYCHKSENWNAQGELKAEAVGVVRTLFAEVLVFTVSWEGEGSSYSFNSWIVNSPSFVSHSTNELRFSCIFYISALWQFLFGAWNCLLLPFVTLLSGPLPHPAWCSRLQPFQGETRPTDKWWCFFLPGKWWTGGPRWDTVCCGHSGRHLETLDGLSAPSWDLLPAHWIPPLLHQCLPLQLPHGERYQCPSACCPWSSGTDVTELPAAFQPHGKDGWQF